MNPATKILEYPEDRNINYIISARFYGPLKLAMARHKAYVRLDSGIEMAETVYKSPLWDKERRFIIVRQEIRLRPRAAGKQLKLFGIGSYMTRNGSQRILKLALAMKRRNWFMGLWERSQSFSYPVVLSREKS